MPKASQTFLGKMSHAGACSHVIWIDGIFVNTLFPYWNLPNVKSDLLRSLMTFHCAFFFWPLKDWHLFEVLLMWISIFLSFWMNIKREKQASRIIGSNFLDGHHKRRKKSDHLLSVSWKNTVMTHEPADLHVFKWFK